MQLARAVLLTELPQRSVCARVPAERIAMQLAGAVLLAELSPGRLLRLRRSRQPLSVACRVLLATVLAEQRLFVIFC
jgi:hypothetical protein